VKRENNMQNILSQPVSKVNSPLRKEIEKSRKEETTEKTK
jgi:hypothetical protein